MSKFTDELNIEIDRRIEIMESPAYERVDKFKKKDFIPLVILAAGSLVVLIATYFM